MTNETSKEAKNHEGRTSREDAARKAANTRRLKAMKVPGVMIVEGGQAAVPAQAEQPEAEVTPTEEATPSEGETVEGEVVEESTDNK